MWQYAGQIQGRAPPGTMAGTVSVRVGHLETGADARKARDRRGVCVVSRLSTLA